MHFYPEDREGSMSQTWHGTKWLEDMPNDMITTMIIHPLCQKSTIMLESSLYTQTVLILFPLDGL